MNERMKMHEARKALTELVETSKEDDNIEHYKELKNASDDQFKKIAEKHGK